MSMHWKRAISSPLSAQLIFCMHRSVPLSGGCNGTLLRFMNISDGVIACICTRTLKLASDILSHKAQQHPSLPA